MYSFDEVFEIRKEEEEEFDIKFMISLHRKSYFKVRLNVNVIIEINLEYLKIKPTLV
jgi:hypothetical protein